MFNKKTRQQQLESENSGCVPFIFALAFVGIIALVAIYVNSGQILANFPG